MSLTPHSFFAHLDPIHQSIQPLTQPTPSSLPSTLSRHDTDVLMSRLSPAIHSRSAHSSRDSPVSPSLQTILEHMQTQISSISDRLDHLSVSRTPVIQAAPIHIDSRSPSCSSIRVVPSSDALSEHFLHVEAEYHRLKIELDARSSTKRNNLPPPPSSILPSTSVLSSSLPFHPTHLSTPPSLCHCKLSSAFQPITRAISPPLSTNSTHLTMQPNSMSSPVAVNNSTTIPSISSSNFPAQDVVSAPTATSLLSLPTVPFHSISSPAFTMNLTNNFPTFKGMAHDKPIKFIKDFEFRVPAHIRDNDALLLETVQQVLSDGALTWFGQLQQSSDRLTRWADFKTRFSERYHTSANVQNLRTELQLLFQGDKETTMDYFDRLKTLLVEIDPDCSDNYIKRKFVQKLRSDIRSRFDADVHLSIADIVRKAQMIESNIEQQKIDEKLKSVAQQEKKNSSILITNNLSTPATSHRTSPASPYSDSSAPRSNNNQTNNNFDNSPRYNSNHRFHPTSHRNSSPNDRHSPNRTDQHQNHSNKYNNNHTNRNDSYHPNHSNNNNNNNHTNRNDSYHQNHSNVRNNHQRPTTTTTQQHSNTPTRPHQSSTNNYNNNDRSTTHTNSRYYCPHCQRPGHSWERCTANPDSINYHANSSSSPPSIDPRLSSSHPPTNAYPENSSGR